jgi:hypothetical protein
MSKFVKPGATVLDQRTEAEKDAALRESTAVNLHHIQKQLVAKGHSIEQVLAVAAKNQFGVSVTLHPPKSEDE